MRGSPGPLGTPQLALALACGVFWLSGCQFTPVEEAPPAETRDAPRLEHIVPEGVARLPVFTPAVRVGDLIFLSGAIGTPASGELRVVEGGVGPETKAAMENLGRILGAAGVGFEDVVKCTVFLADIADFDAMNEVYITFFEGIQPPARSAMAGSGLALNARIEVECIAATR